MRLSILILVALVFTVVAPLGAARAQGTPAVQEAQYEHPANRAVRIHQGGQP